MKIRFSLIARLSAMACFCTLAPSVLAATAPAFKMKPAVEKTSAGTAIRFSLAAPTDVEVAILDAKGRTVRHLVAGYVGGAKKPPAPLVPGLAQRLAWDGKDDKGRPAQGGPFRVRVRLGLQPKFDSFMLFNPDGIPSVQNLAVGPKGNIYVFYHDATANKNQGGVKIKILDRRGRHVRMLLPFSADLPYEKIKATGAFQDKAGHIVPRIHNWHTLSFYPTTMTHHRCRDVSPFSMPVVDKNGRLYWIVLGDRLCALEADGSVPYDDFLGPSVLAGLKVAGSRRPALAISGDGKHVYCAGMSTPCVFKIDVATRKAEIFLGKADQAGKEGALLTSPRGLAVAQGRVYVADPKANRVVVFNESDRTFAGEIKVEDPNAVLVHPKSGAVYVCSYLPASAKDAKRGPDRKKEAEILKYASFKFAKPVYKMRLPKTGLSPNRGLHRIALDPTPERPLIWVPRLRLPGRRRPGESSMIMCYRDTGSGFEVVESNLRKGDWAVGPRDLLVDRKRGDLYVKVGGEQWHQFDEATGKRKRLVKFPSKYGGPFMASSGASLGIDSQGDYITHCWRPGLMRFSRNLKSKNWEGRETHKTTWGGEMTFQLNNMCLLNDEIYVTPQPPRPSRDPRHLDVFDMGLNKKRRAIWNVRKGSIPRTDAKGNIYLTAPLWPSGRDLPPFFDDKLKVPDRYNKIGEGAYWYMYMHASIVKFPPEGGAFYWKESKWFKNETKGIPENTSSKPKVKYQRFSGRETRQECELQGAKWVRYGFSPYSETYACGTPACMCEGAGFDVDPYGRVFYPNLCRFRVEVVDTDSNFITHFGRYGNQDAGLNNDLESETAPQATPSYIPFAWPTYVAVSDDYAYVNDTVNLRVVRVKLDYAATETVALR